MRDTPFIYCTHADTKLNHHRESETGQRFSKETQYDWNEPEDGMKTEKETNLTGHLPTVWGKPGKTRRNISV